MMNKFVVLMLALGFILLNLASSSYGDLVEGFYDGKCKKDKDDVESIIHDVVEKRFRKDPSIVASLLRMQFHDCFVSGCDASLLLDGSSSEKTAPPNRSVRDYDLIDEAKAAVDKKCKPDLISCADIIAIATRDAVALSGGFNAGYKVQTGRRDGFVSLASNVDLPGPSISVSQSIAAFAKKGLDPTDMVLLLGGHTVGIAHCSLIQDRLYNFNNTAGKTDPDMDDDLARTLKLRCPQNSNTGNTVNLDQNPFSSLTVDNSYYQQIARRRGILQIDQGIALDSKTKDTVMGLAMDGVHFKAQFGQAMVKMGAIGVLLKENEGEIRKSCRTVNPKSS